MLGTPFLHDVPLVARALHILPPANEPSRLWLVGQAVALTADMLLLMILLERFYGFLLDRGVRSARRPRSGPPPAGTSRARSRSAAGWSARSPASATTSGGASGTRSTTACASSSRARCCAARPWSCALERGLRDAGGGPRRPVVPARRDHQRGARRRAGALPAEPAPDALAPALRALAKRAQHMSGVACEFSAAGDVLVPDPSAAQHVYRIAQEAISNAVRHAGASRIARRACGAARQPGAARCEDDGVGMPAAEPRAAWGCARWPSVRRCSRASSRSSRRRRRHPRGLPRAAGLLRPAARPRFPGHGGATMSRSTHGHRDVAPPVRILVVDDHPAVREGLALLVSSEGMEVSAEAGRVSEALATRRARAARTWPSSTCRLTARTD